MKNWFGCVSLVLLLALGGCVFAIAQHMHTAQNDLASVMRQIVQEQDSLRVLQAEWTYLNNPARLERLAAGFGLQPLDGRQYVTIAALPTQAAMRGIELAQNQSAKQNAVRRQQLDAAIQPSDSARVDRALTLADLAAPAAALPAPMDVALDVTAGNTE